MIIHMTHPLHGEMDVYTEVAVTANEKNGWKKSIKMEIPEIPAIEAKNNVSDVPNDITKLRIDYEAKFGKKPHHRMSQSTIEAALKE